MCSRRLLVSLLGYMVEGVPLERAPKSPHLLHHSPGAEGKQLANCAWC